MPARTQRRAPDAANVPQIHVRVTEWLEEIQRLGRSTPSLTPAARTAVLSVLASFESEDGSLAEPALEARAALNAAPVPPEASHASPTRAQTLPDAQAARLHTQAPQRPDQTAA